MTATPNLAEAIKSPFGTIFTDKMAIAHFKGGEWTPFAIEPHRKFEMSPASHVFHYSSACFEGLKAHRQAGGVYTFRLQDHMNRLFQSAGLLCLPQPDPAFVAEMIRENIRACADWVPEAPGSLYIRPTLIGTLESIGAAASPSTEAMLYILLSPVGDYFSKGIKPLRVLLDDEAMRTSPSFGIAKTGGNYAAALHRIMKARKEHGADQVLFAPGGDVQETGAANFLLINDREVLTKGLCSAFLHGVTRDSILKLAADLGYKVSERDISPAEVIEWIKTGEAALSGTAAVLSGIGSMVYRGESFQVGNGEVGPNTNRLRQGLLEIQRGQQPDAHGWMEKIC